MSSSYTRCRHCRGFSELALALCKYCGKNVPNADAAGSPRIFVDRETCRAIQIAEYEQLPAEAHEDGFQPDPLLLDKQCYCLHCGPDGPLFEAVEMRWLANENMWACPCTTCGGRGFTFDIHLVERLWQCAECDHWYTPVNGDFRTSNAKCPECGSIHANGWFDDETDEEEWNDEAKEGELMLNGAEPPPIREEDLPWSAEDDKRMAEERAERQRLEEETEDDAEGGLFDVNEPNLRERMPDDIEFPREKSERPDMPADDDIPW